MFENEDDFEEEDIRYYVNRLLEDEEAEDKFYFTWGERREFQSIVLDAIEMYIEQRRLKNDED